MSKVLIISGDVVGQQMAGPAIRCYEFARVLSMQHDVVLGIPKLADIDSNDFTLSVYDRSDLTELVRKSDVVVVSGYLIRKYPVIAEQKKAIVVDIYDPFILENLEIHADKEMTERAHIHRADLGVLNELLQLGDFFICASEKQRDFWLGMLAALNRINPYTYSDDRTLRRLIDVVPFGLPSKEAVHSKQVLKGVRKGIQPTDKIIYWGGGIWNWFDPITLIRAMSHICAVRNDVKLFFAGVKHPNPEIPEMKMCSDAIALSKELDLFDKFVFFNAWIPYNNRVDYLLEADIGISLHLEHLETQFSFRTRILDYIWASLPIITTCGDALADLVEEKSLGMTVGFNDISGVEEAILTIIDDDLAQTYRRNEKETAQGFKWEEIIGPLSRFCMDPVRAVDLRDKNNTPNIAEGTVSRAKRVYKKIRSRL